MPDKGPFHECVTFVGYGAPAPGGAARAPLGACRASCTAYLERPPRAPSSIFGAPKNGRPSFPPKKSPPGGSNERKFERTPQQQKQQSKSVAVSDQQINRHPHFRSRQWLCYVMALLCHSSAFSFMISRRESMTRKHDQGTCHILAFSTRNMAVTRALPHQGASLLPPSLSIDDNALRDDDDDLPPPYATYRAVTLPTP